jgi:hypothetical protein
MWTERAPQHLLWSKLFPRLVALATVLWMPASFRIRVPFDVFHPVLTQIHIPYRLKPQGVGIDEYVATV